MLAGALTLASTVAPPAPVDPAAPVAPVPGPEMTLQLDGATLDGLSNPVALVLLLAVVSLVPALLLAATAFTRIIIVLSFLRSALSTPGIPPNQVLIGLALFLSAFVMAPTLTEANDVALQPYLAGTLSTSDALSAAQEPFRAFMLANVRESDLRLFLDMSGAARPENAAAVPTTTLVPAFVLSELRTAFLIGFVVFVPFLVVDLVVSAALTALGMVMLPPALVSLPVKVLVFVAADGWALVVGSLVRSFAAPAGGGP